jgi:hypothetical protein
MPEPMAVDRRRHRSGAESNTQAALVLQKR